MKFIKSIVIVIIVCLINACTPVSQTTNNNTNNSKSSKTSKSTSNAKNSKTESTSTNENKNQTNSTASSLQQNKKQKNVENNPIEKRKQALKNITSEEERFIDTTYLFLAMENGKTSIGLNSNGYSSAGQEPSNSELIQMFNKAIEESEKGNNFNCSYFKYFVDRFNFNDSLRQEAAFYIAECNINNNNLDEALIQLETLSNDKLNKGTAPKVLVRIGQIYCVNGDKEQAEKYFKKLKKSYPKSIYNQLADCSRL